MFVRAFAIIAIGQLASFVVTSAGEKSKPLQIGMAKSFLGDTSKGVVSIAADEFQDVMKKTTGLNGDLSTQFGAAEIADKLQRKQLDLGIFHAHEFAWMQKKYPDLKPLLIAANKNQVERAHLIVHAKSPAKTIADLRGKKLDMPSGTKEVCRVFLETACSVPEPKGLAKFFGTIEKSASPIEALDNLARQKVDALVINTSNLEFYKEVKGPIFEKNLRVLIQSEVFPPAVIVYKPGVLREATLTPFRDGLLKAHTTDAGRDLMKTWNIDAFESIPKDYAKSLADVLKAYPTPR